jgi:hypothetical protein
MSDLHHFTPPLWTRRAFLTGSAAAVAAAYAIAPAFSPADQMPDKFDGLAFNSSGTGRMRDGYFVERYDSGDPGSNMFVLDSCWRILDSVSVCEVTVSD